MPTLGGAAADDPDDVAPIVSGPSQGFDTAGLLVPLLRDIRAPAMYTALGPPAGTLGDPSAGSVSHNHHANPSKPAPSPLNLRASWLAGRPVRGDAVLSAVRLRPNEWGTPAVKYGSFSTTEYALWAAATLPAGQHGARVGMPLLACLPQLYTCAPPCLA